MNDIDMDFSKLSIPARQTLVLLDNYIDIAEAGAIILKAKVIQLYYERWNELDGSISFQSGRDFSLKENTYRGMEIVSWDGE